MDRAVTDPLPILAPPVRLRRFMPTDLVAFQRYRGDPVLARYQGWRAMTDEAARAFITEMQRMPLLQAGRWTQIALADPVSDGLIGDLGVFVADDAATAEIGFTVARSAQGRGVATAAARAALALVFAHTPVRRVLGVTDARNTASVRVLERLGLQRIEVREVVFKDEPCTEWVYAISAPAAPPATPAGARTPPGR
jgi:aminoglycoside 6'-N-acetyltransferase